MIDAQRTTILQASAALELCTNNYQQRFDGTSSSFSLTTPKRSKTADKRLNDIGLGSHAHIEANRTMLIACRSPIFEFVYLNKFGIY